MKANPMQYLILAVALLVGAATAGPSRRPASVANPAFIHLGNEGKAFPAMRESFDSTGGFTPLKIHLDTAEVDSGFIFFNVLEKPVLTYTDTVGTFTFSVKDSTGTDTIAVRGYWYGNPRPDAKGSWTLLDSLSCQDLTTAEKSAYKTCSKVVVSTGQYALLWFRLKNLLTASAASKATVKEPTLITKKRLGGVH